MLILGGSMQQLWGMIRALQMVVLSGLVKTPIPTHTFLFFKVSMTFAQMDILDGKGFYEEWFNFRQTSSIDDMWEMMDYSDKNFLNNSGSYFVITAILVGYYLCLFLLNKVATTFPKCRCCRRIGI
jgi:hypothetical protein